MRAKVQEVKYPDGRHYAWQFWCEACVDTHTLSGWTFDGNLAAPSFHPSVLVYPDERIHQPRCHSVITNGIIAYCPDSSHVYANQSLPLLDFPNRFTRNCWELIAERRRRPLPSPAAGEAPPA